MPTLITENGSIDYNKYTRESVLSNDVPVITRSIYDIYTKFNVDRTIYVIYNAYVKSNPIDFTPIVQEFIDKIPDKPQSDIILCNSDTIRSPKNYIKLPDAASAIQHLKTMYAENHKIMKDVGFKDIMFYPMINGYMAPFMIYYNNSTKSFMDEIKSYFK